LHHRLQESAQELKTQVHPFRDHCGIALIFDLPFLLLAYQSSLPHVWCMFFTFWIPMWKHESLLDYQLAHKTVFPAVIGSSNTIVSEFLNSLRSPEKTDAVDEKLGVKFQIDVQFWKGAWEKHHKMEQVLDHLWMDAFPLVVQVFAQLSFNITVMTIFALFATPGPKSWMCWFLVALTLLAWIFMLFRPITQITSSCQQLETLVTCHFIRADMDLATSVEYLKFVHYLGQRKAETGVRFGPFGQLNWNFVMRKSALAAGVFPSAVFLMKNFLMEHEHD